MRTLLDLLMRNLAFLLFKFAGQGLPPTIVGVSGGGSYDTGDTVSLSVSTTGSAPLSYQWRKNGTPISGATGSSYSISGAGTSASGNYSVTVTNPWGSVTSSSVSVYVSDPPEPPSISVSGGGSYPLSHGAVTLTAYVSGDGSIVINWVKDGEVGPYPTGTTYSVSPPVTGFPGTPTTGSITITANAYSDYGSASDSVTVTWT